MQKISNAEIKKIRSLAQKKFRDGYGLFVAEGEKMVAEAMASGFGVTAVYRRDEIGEVAMGRISQLAAPSPVLAVVRKPTGLVLEDEYGFREALGLDRKSGQVSGSGKGGLFLLLDTIRDPGNLGTIIRTANGAGYEDIYLKNCTNFLKLCISFIPNLIPSNTAMPVLNALIRALALLAAGASGATSCLLNRFIVSF